MEMVTGLYHILDCFSQMSLCKSNASRALLYARSSLNSNFLPAEKPTGEGCGLN